MNTPDKSPDDLDALIRQAMQARPIPHANPGLAARAMALAAQRRPEIVVDEPDWNQIAVLRRRGTLLNAVAAIVLVGLISVCYLQISGSSNSAETGTASSMESVADSAVESTSSELVWGLTADQWLLATAAMVVGIITLLCVEKAMLEDRSGWQAFRAAGSLQG